MWLRFFNLLVCLSGDVKLAYPNVREPLTKNPKSYLHTKVDTYKQKRKNETKRNLL